MGADYDTPMKKVTAQIRDTVPSIQVLNPGVPKPITRLLERMLAKDPKQRIASPSEKWPAYWRRFAKAAS